MDYKDFIATKSASVKPSGFKVNPEDLHPALFEFQRGIVARALYQGKFCNGSDTGLGKSLMSMAWADMACRHTDIPTLILAPLAVSHQFEREGQKFSIPIQFVDDESQMTDSSIYTTNYEKLHRFPSIHCNVVLDEGSILKNYAGKTSKHIIERFHNAPFKLSASATFAPNDMDEIGMQSEFLGVMTRAEMQAQFFVHDGGNTSKWRLKKWGAQDKFWEWLSSWCCLVKLPSDVGNYSNDGYTLPGLNEINVPISTPVNPPEGVLPGCWVPSGKTADKRHINKTSIHERCAKAAEIAWENGKDKQWIIWCNSNAESELLAKIIPDAVEVAGRHSDEYKIESIESFQRGDVRVIVTKDKIFGFGINLQNCWNTIVFPNDSYEKYYQLVRRFYRFGQQHTVNVYRVFHELEGYSTMPNLKRKGNQADTMFKKMRPFQLKAFGSDFDETKRLMTEYNPSHEIKIPDWLSTQNHE